MMRLAMVALLVWGVGVGSAAAAPTPNCPTRSAVIDAIPPLAPASDLWRVVFFGSVVSLSAAHLGVSAGIAVSVIGGGLAALSGLGTLAELDTMIRQDLPDAASRFGLSADEMSDQISYLNQVIATSWLMRVAGATVGSIVGLLVPLDIGSFEGLRGSVFMGTAGGVVIGGLWHRLALWPFHDDPPAPCGGAINGLRL
jgi:hypothetical protein